MFTIYGACCSFNYSPLDLQNVIVINQASQFSGIHILFAGQNIPNTGINLIISFAGEFITPYDSTFKLFPGCDNFFRLQLEKILTHQYFDRLSFKSRRCVSPTDGSDIGFYRSWCIMTCLLENIYKECDCHPFQLPILTQRSANMRKCTVKDLICFRTKTGKLIFDMAPDLITLKKMIFFFSNSKSTMSALLTEM